MTIPSIETMTPKMILVKEAFKRAIPSDIMEAGGKRYPLGDDTAKADPSRDPLRYELVNQSDFLREFDMNAHRINSLKFYPNPFVADSDNKYKQKIKSRISIAFQERIFTKRLTTLVGNNVNFRIANYKTTAKDQEMLALFREGWQMKNMENALYQALAADGKTGDCAICFWLDEGRFGYRVFSYENGDVLYPHYNPVTGELCLLGRTYSQYDSDGKEYVQYLDVWDNTSYCRYRYNLKGVKGLVASVVDKVGGDAWVLDEEPKQHNFPRIPIAYDRYGAPFWGNSQSLIDAYELAISQLAENNAAYALRILYTLGESMSLKSTLDGTPTRIDSPNADAKVGYLEPADSSKSFELQLTTLEKNIMKCSFAVETPEIKSGSDMSSLTVKMLFADSYQKALLDAQHFQPFLDDVVTLFKYAYGIDSGEVSDMNAFKVKAEIFPYIFMSETEQVANIIQLRSSGALSRQTASELGYELGYGINSEYKRILQEEHDALVGQQQTTTTVSAEGLDNQTNNPVNNARKAAAAQN